MSFKYKKHLGQNFLIDENITKKITRLADIEDNSLIIEIGPGSGMLTKELVKTPAQVLSFEIDTNLKETLDNLKHSNLKIIYQDFLKVELEKEISEYNYNKLYVIANVPYYITTPIIEKVIKEINVDKMILMVQKEVGNRFKAKTNTKEYNSLSVFLQYYFDINKLMDVSKNVFFPKPNVDSVVIEFKKKEKIKVNNEEFFFKFVRDSFKQKRKNLRNNLRNYNLEAIEKALKEIKKDLTSRAEELTLEDFAYISNKIS